MKSFAIGVVMGFIVPFEVNKGGSMGRQMGVTWFGVFCSGGGFSNCRFGKVLGPLVWNIPFRFFLERRPVATGISRFLEGGLVVGRIVRGS